ncbi:hypothetical protein SCYAM73S_03507 [Streptomyces cyaneofuscatus]
MESGNRDTIADLVADRWDDHRPGLWCGERVLTHHEVAAGAAARAALLADLLPAGAHIGVLLDNTPEYPLWLSAAALARVAVAGINPTRRGPELARDILHTECRILITDGFPLRTWGCPGRPDRAGVVERGELAGDGLAGVRRPARALRGSRPAVLRRPGRPSPPLLHLGTTGAPKAALCSQGRLAAAGRSLEPTSSPYARTTCTTCACRCSTATR